MTPLNIVSLLTFIICQGIGVGMISAGDPLGVVIMVVSSVSGYFGISALVGDLKR